MSVINGSEEIILSDFIDINEKAWSNITISIENFKFIVEYNYEDLANSAYTSYDRHIIWRYKYLKTGLTLK